MTKFTGLVSRGDTDITKRYRPRKFAEILGNANNVTALIGALGKGNKRKRAYLLTGNFGCVLGDTIITVRKKSNNNKHKLNVSNPEANMP